MKKPDKETKDEELPLDMDSPYVKEINSAGFIVVDWHEMTGSRDRCFLRPKNIEAVFAEMSCGGTQAVIWIKRGDEVPCQQTSDEIMQQIVRINERAIKDSIPF